MSSQSPTEGMHHLRFLPEALEDLKKLEGHQLKAVHRQLKKIANAPLTTGKWLENRDQTRLAGLRSVRADDSSIRIVWKVVNGAVEVVLVVVVSKRAEEAVYKTAQNRRERLRSSIELIKRELAAEREGGRGKG